MLSAWETFSSGKVTAAMFAYFPGVHEQQIVSSILLIIYNHVMLVICFVTVCPSDVFFSFLFWNILMLSAIVRRQLEDLEVVLELRLSRRGNRLVKFHLAEYLGKHVEYSSWEMLSLGPYYKFKLTYFLKACSTFGSMLWKVLRSTIYNSINIYRRRCFRLYDGKRFPNYDPLNLNMFMSSNRICSNGSKHFCSLIIIDLQQKPLKYLNSLKQTGFNTVIVMPIVGTIQIISYCSLGTIISISVNKAVKIMPAIHSQNTQLFPF